MEGSLFTTTKELLLEHLRPIEPKFLDPECKAEFFVPDQHGRKTEVKVDLQKQIVMVYSSIPNFQISGKEKIKRLVKFMAKVNEQLYFGNLEFNFETAETRYKTSQIFQGISDPRNSIRFLLQQHADNFPRLSTALKRLIEEPTLDPIVLAQEAVANPPSS